MKKISPTNQLSWVQYIRLSKNNTIQQEQQLKLSEFDGFFMSHFLPYCMLYTYILDYSTGKYIHMSDNFAGYKSEVYLNHGLNHTLDIYHPDHLKVFNKQIFPDRLEIMKTIRPEEHKNYMFSFSTCAKNKNGFYENFMQRNFFISDINGNPIYSVGILISINNVSAQQPIIQTVDKIDGNGFIAENFYKKTYHLHEEEKIFTKREKEVLQLMADGLNSKMIANKLFTSEHTIINHRRNMQEKSNTPNAVAMISFAIRNGLI